LLAQLWVGILAGDRTASYPAQSECSVSDEFRPLASVDENNLVSMAKTDQDAFGELYTRYVKRIYNYVFYRTGSHEDAEDITARVFQRALQHIPNYEDRGVPFSAWLYRIAHNLVVNWHRDRKRRTVIPLDDLVLAAFKSQAPEKATEKNEQKEHLLQAIRSLPDERQLLLVLKFVEHMSNADIGAIMGRSEGAIKSLYHRTLIALRDEMGRMQQTTSAQRR
jgi:RNA polymerase sigma-70 factor (ECF subfamily)